MHVPPLSILFLTPSSIEPLHHVQAPDELSDHAMTPGEATLIATRLCLIPEPLP
jgi:hypothetical protein